MSIFYDRTETDTEIVITYKAYLFYFSVPAALLIGYIEPSLNIISTLGLAIFTVVYMIDLWRPSRELSKAMKKGSVEMTGSKYSYKNPLKVTIRKTS